MAAVEAALDYEQQLRQLYPDVSLPKIDLLLLGVGPDGHTCSLFPGLIAKSSSWIHRTNHFITTGHALLGETKKWVAPIEDSPKPPPCRVTLTYPVINNAKCGLFVAIGTGKADIIKVTSSTISCLETNRDDLYFLITALVEGQGGLAGQSGQTQPTGLDFGSECGQSALNGNT